jgi:putative transferase (TIGR04331 family)
MNFGTSLVLASTFTLKNKRKKLLFFKYNEKLFKQFNCELYKSKNGSKYFKKNLVESQRLVDKILPILAKRLNHVHQVNLDLIFWRVTLEKWLRDFIYSTHLFYNQIFHVLKNNEIKSVFLMKSENFDFSINKTSSLYYAFRDKEWFYNFLSVLYLNFKTNRQKKIFSKNKKKVFLEKEKNYTSTKKYFIKFYSYLISFLRNKNCPLILNSSLPFFFEKYLEIKDINFPQFYYEKKYKSSNITNKKLRKRLLFKTTSKNKLEKFLLENIYKFVPKCFVEDFKKVNFLSNNFIYPKNPKFILTGYEYSYNEVFKFYAANKVSKKFPLYIAQHGNNFFSRLDYIDEPEKKFASNYLSWGYKKEKKIKPFFNFKTYNTIKYKINLSGKIIFLFDDIGSSPKMHYENVFMHKQLELSKVFINNCEPALKKRLLLRLKPSFSKNYFDTNYAKSFYNLGVRVDSGQKPIKELLRDCSLTIYNYDSTGVLENFLNNIPTLILVPSEFNFFLRSDIKKKYGYLYEANIMFNCPNKLIKHINSIETNVYKWWKSKNTSKAIKLFNKDFNENFTKSKLKKFNDFLFKK